MKIYTRNGDGGQTGIWGGVRLAKDEARMEAIGSVDELNAAIGLAAAAAEAADCFDDGDPVPGLLGWVQQDLLVAGTELMAPSREGPGADLPRLAGAKVTRLETAIDDLTARLPELRNFIVPGGTETAACLHLARAVCRRRRPSPGGGPPQQDMLRPDDGDRPQDLAPGDHRRRLVNRHSREGITASQNSARWPATSGCTQ